MSWYKKARGKGMSQDQAEDYSQGYRPKTEDHIPNPDGLTTYSPEFGGNRRGTGGPRNFSQNPENRDDDDTAYLKGLPGEAVLMDDGGDSHEGLGDRFVAQDEFNTDNDRTTIRDKELDNIDVGPHNMQNRNVLNKIKNKIKTRGIKI
jgi:hypothetical protein